MGKKSYFFFSFLSVRSSLSFLSFPWVGLTATVRCARARGRVNADRGPKRDGGGGGTGGGGRRRPKRPGDVHFVFLAAVWPQIMGDGPRRGPPLHLHRRVGTPGLAGEKDGPDRLSDLTATGLGSAKARAARLSTFKVYGIFLRRELSCPGAVSPPG